MKSIKDKNPMTYEYLRKEYLEVVEALDDTELREAVERFLRLAKRDSIKSFNHYAKHKVSKSSALPSINGVTYTATTLSNLDGLGLLTVEGIMSLCSSPLLSVVEMFRELELPMQVQKDVGRLLKLMGYVQRSRSTKGTKEWVYSGRYSTTEVEAQAAYVLDKLKEIENNEPLTLSSLM